MSTNTLTPQQETDVAYLIGQYNLEDRVQSYSDKIHLLAVEHCCAQEYCISMVRRAYNEWKSELSLDNLIEERKKRSQHDRYLERRGEFA